MDILKQIDIKKLFSLDYIFEKNPPAISNYLYLSFIFGFFIILGIFFWVWNAREKNQLFFWKKYKAKLFNLFIYTGLVGLILVFSRWQEIPYLGSRLFLIIDLLVFIVWGLIILYFRMLILPKEIINYRKIKDFEKYLPKNKKEKNEKF